MNHRKRRVLFAAYNFAGKVSRALGRTESWFRRKLQAFIATEQRPRRILVLCHGNICRSPFVEHLLKQRLDEENFIVSSGGLRTTSGKPADPAAIRAAKEFGVELGGHRTRQVDRAEVEAADLVIVMDPTHLLYLKELSPITLSRTFLLGAFGLTRGQKLVISDPYAKSDEIFQQCYRHLGTCTDAFVKELEDLQ